MDNSGKSKILLLSLTFSPDNVSTAQIMAGLATDLKAAGHSVKVITTTPHYHRDSGMEAVQPIRWLVWPFVKKSVLEGVDVYHVPMPDKSVATPIRILSWLWFHFVSILVAPFVGRVDWIISCSPPMTIGVVAWFIAFLKRAKYVYTVQELYPDIAVSLGKLRNPALITFFSAMERFIYRKAVYVTSITEAMCAKIRERVDPEKVKLIPNFVDVPSEEETRLAKDNSFSVEYALKGKFVIAYAGNMGEPQKLDILVEAAPMLPEGVVVLFVGAGGAKDALVARAKELGVLGNRVIFAAYQPLSRMPEIYASSDIFYVGQDPRAHSDGIPSKIYRILGNAKPILAVTSKGADMAKFVEESGGGVVVDDFSPKTLSAEIGRLVSDGEELARISRKGREFVSSNFSKSRITSMYGELVSSRSI